jgi:hypothetical protein
LLFYKPNTQLHGLYTENPAGSLADFREFLTRVERRRLLPDWWDGQRRQACVGIAEGSNPSSIQTIVEKQDIQEMYGASTMPMVFRTIADRIYGKAVMAQ